MSTKVIKPLKDQVLVKLLKKDKTESGIVIPETVQNASEEGFIVMDKGVDVSQDINIGDSLLFMHDKSIRIKAYGVEEGFFLVAEKDIIAILANAVEEILDSV